MVWVTHALAFLAGGTIGAALMAAVQINKMQDRLDERH